MLSIVTMLMPMLLKIVGYYWNKKIEKGEASEEGLRAYRNFLFAMDQSAGDSARLRRSTQAQIKRLKEQLREGK